MQVGGGQAMLQVILQAALFSDEDAMCRVLTKQARSDHSWPDICFAVQQFHHQVPHITTTIKHGFLPWRSEDMQAHVPNAAWNRYVTKIIL